MNRKKVLSCRFQQRFGTLTMLLLQGFPVTGRLRHLSDHVYAVHKFGDTKSMRVIFFFNKFKI